MGLQVGAGHRAEWSLTQGQAVRVSLAWRWGDRQEEPVPAQLLSSLPSLKMGSLCDGPALTYCQLCTKGRRQSPQVTPHTLRHPTWCVTRDPRRGAAPPVRSGVSHRVAIPAHSDNAGPCSKGIENLQPGRSARPLRHQHPRAAPASLPGLGSQWALQSRGSLGENSQGLTEE